MQSKVKSATEVMDELEVIKVSEGTEYLVMYTLSALIMLSSLFFNSPKEIYSGIIKILVEPSVLVSDYMFVANIGAAFFNAGILMIITLTIAKFEGVIMSGPTIAAVFTVGGFALFGKNLYNIWSIMLGVYLYSLFKKEPFNKYILMAAFGTALAPLVSQITYGFGLPLIIGIIAGNLIGIMTGFFIPPLASHFVNFHQGFNLYNIGFTAGIVGTIFMAFFRSFDLEIETRLLIVEGYNTILAIYLTILFVAMIIIGFYYNNCSFKGLLKLMERKGKLGEDFVLLNGFGISFINMGILGLISIIYVIMVDGPINGPIIGGIFTVAGFGGFGKHPKNVIPIMTGVFLGANLMKWELNSTGTLLAALFGTTLSPVAGEYGWKSGILAGFFHIAMVMNVGSLHGGINLYNNGFSGGLVAAILVPILNSLRRTK